MLPFITRSFKNLFDTVCPLHCISNSIISVLLFPFSSSSSSLFPSMKCQFQFQSNSCLCLMRSISCASRKSRNKTFVCWDSIKSNDFDAGQKQLRSKQKKKNIYLLYLLCSYMFFIIYFLKLCNFMVSLSIIFYAFPLLKKNMYTVTLIFAFIYFLFFF